MRNRELARPLTGPYTPSQHLPAPEFMHDVLGEFADTLLTGQKVLPQRLLDAGFNFNFPYIDRALADLMGHGTTA